MKRNHFEQLRAMLPTAALVAAGASLVIGSGLLAPIDRGVSDALVRLGAGRPPARPARRPDVAVVAVDARSLRAYDSWPWPRSLYALAIEQLEAAGARAIAFDVDFSTPSEPEEDSRFAQALSNSGRVVLAAFRQRQSLPGGGELEVVNVPTRRLLEAAATTGSVLVPTDPDGVVRRAPRASEIGGRPMASLALAALAAADGESAEAGAPESFIVDYRRALPAFPVISIVELIEGRFDRGDIAGRVVFVGATAAEFQDLWTTPLGPAQPGVFIQAIAARTLAAEAAGQPMLRTASSAQRHALVWLLSLALAALGTLRHSRRLACLLGAAGAIQASAVVLVIGAGVVIDPVVPLAVIAAHYVLGIEGVRQRFGRLLAAHDSALAALTRVGEATTRGAGEPGREESGLERALALLGEAVGAARICLLQTDDQQALDGRRLDWTAASERDGAPGAGRCHADRERALAVMARSRAEVVEGRPHGSAARSPLANRGSSIYTPLSADGCQLGVLIVESDDDGGLDPTRRRTIATAAAQLALSVQNLRLLEELRRTFSSSMAAVAAAVEARDGYTDLHCRRLSAFSSMMAGRLGMRSDEIKAVELGALLHDVGKIGIPDAVLNKPGRFTPEERIDMQRHPVIGAGIVGSVHGLHEATLQCVRSHHECWNGGGYPDGLVGESIPLPARIVGVVDVWDALSSHRPYKRPLPQDRVLKLLDKGRGEQFDPEIVDLFLRVLQEQGDEMLALIDRDAREGKP